MADVKAWPHSDLRAKAIELAEAEANRDPGIEILVALYIEKPDSRTLDKLKGTDFGWFSAKAVSRAVRAIAANY